MNCEICGTEIKGQSFTTKIDNSTMITCKACSKFGVIQKKPRITTKSNKNNKSSNKRAYTKSQKPEYEIVDNYSMIIRQAREKHKLTREKLSEKLYEKESVLGRVETGKMMPDTKLARKIEKILNIKIIEKVESEIDEHNNIKRFRETTIGDIARIKKEVK